MEAAQPSQQNEWNTIEPAAEAQPAPPHPGESTAPGQPGRFLESLSDLLLGTSRRSVALWFSLSLAFAAYYALLSLLRGFSSAYIVEDDARLHVFWMQRFLDPELFTNDLIADYLRSTTPAGFLFLYWVPSLFGLDALTFSKILPAILGMAMAVYTFLACLRIAPLPLAGFISTLLLNQAMWLRDDLLSATPRAFFVPLFVAFVYYVAKRSLIPSLVVVALQGLFYPHAVFISLGVLVLWLWRWEDGWLRFSRQRMDLLFCVAGFCAAGIVVVPFALKASEYGPVVTAAAAAHLLEFSRIGRNAFFYGDAWQFWLWGDRSGVLRGTLNPPLLWVGLALPLLIGLRRRFPELPRISVGARPLPQIVIASFGMFFLAHALLFRLHFPSRYTAYTLRIVLALSAGIVLAALVHAILKRASFWHFSWKKCVAGCALFAFVLGPVVLYPFWLISTWQHFPWNSHVVGQASQLYQFLESQPKTSIIASLSAEVDNIPTFARRSIVVGREYSIAFHVGYYARIRERVVDLLRGQYSGDLSAAREAIRKYDVDFWLLERSSLAFEYLVSRTWFRQFEPVHSELTTSLSRGSVPALARVAQACTVFESRTYVLLDAACILNAPDN